MSEKEKKVNYDEETIQTLDALEHIRLRSGMYIGRLGSGAQYDDGIYILLKEVIDNSVDEFVMGEGNRAEINLEENKIIVRDYGRGIPLGKVIDCVSMINTGAKYNDDVFQFSVGLNGVGTKAVNALSIHFKVKSHRDGKYKEAIFSQGKLVSESEGECPDEVNGTLVEFIPDEEIFGEFAFNSEFIEQRLWNYAYLNRGLKLFLGDEKFESKGGLKDLLNAEVGDERSYDVCYHRAADNRLEFAFTHTENYGEMHFSFVNGQYTSAGGSHQAAFREGILKGVREYGGKNYASQDVRDGVVGAVAIRLKDPIFESQTKNKLGNTDVRAWLVSEVRVAVADFLHKNEDTAQILVDKIERNERLRKELASVKKKAKEVAKKVSIKIPNLKDCKHHLTDGEKGELSTIFLTEGQSASGSMISSRDVYLQAIFSLKGKPQNAYGKDKAAIYKNEELYNIMKTLGIEDGIENLRYGRVVIATDADVDGFHIRNLILTFFLNYFEELVVEERIFVLETPLFRVRNKKITRYCYSIKERDKALKEIPNNEVTRFKGLGEISPSEFGQFIGDDIRLVEVNLKSIQDIKKTLEFYMGKNTPERRDYIMENLI